MRRLLIRPGGIGDCILSFPALEHLVTESTEVWVPSPVVPLVHFAHLVRAISETGIDLLGLPDLEPPHAVVRQLRTFDSIVSWYGANRHEFREACAKIAPNTTFHQALPPSDQRQHATDFFLSQVGAQLGSLPTIDVGSAPVRDSVVIHPFSGSPSKNWPIHFFEEVGSRLKLEVEWTAGREETLPGALRFDNLAALSRWLRGCRLYIGNDSGITHLAAAVKVPTIAIFVSTSPSTWAPRGPNVAVLDKPDIHEVQMAADRLLRAM